MDNDPDTKWMDNSFTNSVFFETPQVRMIPREGVIFTPVMQRLRIVRMQISTDHHELPPAHGQRRRGARPLQVEAEPQLRLQQQLGRGGRPQCQRPDRGALQPPGLVPDVHCRRRGKCACLAPRSSLNNPHLQDHPLTGLPHVLPPGYADTSPQGYLFPPHGRRHAWFRPVLPALHTNRGPAALRRHHRPDPHRRIPDQW